ncbi:hypothetical protein MKEN_01327400 [Mycena kentingensis (nom. inval.)]|nr:hypothetical protein MKEN_01327400 [Mycena kentingensis (nom. inval.)]
MRDMPLELLDMVARELGPADMASFSSTKRTLSALMRPRLYRTIVLAEALQAIRFFRTATEQPALAALDTEDEDTDLLNGATLQDYSVVALRNLTALEELAIVNPVDVLMAASRVNFPSLRQCRMAFIIGDEEPSARFLRSHPNIRRAAIWLRREHPSSEFSPDLDQVCAAALAQVEEFSGPAFLARSLLRNATGITRLLLAWGQEDGLVPTDYREVLNNIDLSSKPSLHIGRFPWIRSHTTTYQQWWPSPRANASSLPGSPYPYLSPAPRTPSLATPSTRYHDAPPPYAWYFPTAYATPGPLHTPLPPTPASSVIPLPSGHDDDAYHAGYDDAMYDQGCRPRGRRMSRSRPKLVILAGRSRSSQTRKGSRGRAADDPPRGRSREASREWVRNHTPASAKQRSAMRQLGAKARPGPRSRVHWFDGLSGTASSGDGMPPLVDRPRTYPICVSPPPPSRSSPPSSPYASIQSPPPYAYTPPSPHPKLHGHDIHPLLEGGPSLALDWNVTTFPTTASLTGPAHTHFCDPAFPTRPPWQTQHPVLLKIILPNIALANWLLAAWGPIPVHAPAPTPGLYTVHGALVPAAAPPIRIQDVLDAVYTYLHTPITAREGSYILTTSPRAWWAAGEMMHKRIKEGRTGDLAEVARRKGVLRSDLLGGATRFGGMWVMGGGVVGLALV